MAGAAVSTVDRSQAAQPSRPGVVPTLSVTVLNYNYGSYLPGCLDSILNQTFRDFELIVIDDCSTDNSLDVIEPYLADPRVRLVAHQANVGYCGSLIEGTEIQSSGELVTVISADDLVHRPDAFERQIALLQAHPSATFCFSGYERFLHETGEVVQEQHSYLGDRLIPGPVFLREYLTRQQTQVLHTGTMLRKSAYLRAGGYRRDLRMTLDFAMWPMLALQGDVAYCDQPLYAYRTHAAQMSSSFKKQHANFVEVMKSVDGACDAAVRQGLPIGDLREDAIRYALFAVALDDAFGGRPALAWYRTVSAVLLQPRLAVSSRGLWITLARLLFGARGYVLARSLYRKLTGTRGC
jgi:glycosyltransferase involved in cell wall biosynthesis